MEWCQENGEEAGTPEKFYDLLGEHGWAQHRSGSAGRRFWGIRLKTPKERADYEADRARREAAGDTTRQGLLKTGGTYPPPRVTG